jgi:hypothetical protein
LQVKSDEMSKSDVGDVLTSKSSSNDQDIDVEVVCVRTICASSFAVFAEIGLQDTLGLRFLSNGTHCDCCDGDSLV